MDFKWNRWPWTREGDVQLVADANLIAENSRLKRERDDLVKSLDAAKTELALWREQERKRLQLIDIDMGDPSPIDKEKRMAYVAQIAGVYKDILEPKLKHMLSKLHTEMEDQSADGESDRTMKGVAYAFRELMRWGTLMVSEQVSNQTGQNPARAEEDINK